MFERIKAWFKREKALCPECNNKLEIVKEKHKRWEDHKGFNKRNSKDFFPHIDVYAECPFCGFISHQTVVNGETVSMWMGNRHKKYERPESKPNEMVI
jgi:ribulose-5-phosphate 4-epimerase/fuculose-1-phosphate aldolase